MANVVTPLYSSDRVFTVLASAARTATPDTQEFDGSDADFRGAFFVIDATAVTATPALTVTISGVDRTSGKVYTILASAAIATVSTTVLQIGPGLTAAGNAVANSQLPPIFRVTASHGDADSITYSIGCCLIP